MFCPIQIIRYAVLFVLVNLGSAFAGTTSIDFTQGIGILDVFDVFNAIEITDDCKLRFRDRAVCTITDGATPQRVAKATGEIAVTIGVNPYEDAKIRGSVVLQLFVGGNYIFVDVIDDGVVALENFDRDWREFITFDNPDAPDGTVTLHFDTATAVATISASGTTETVSLPPDALMVGMPVNISVASFGGGSFRSITATGDGIPEIDATGECGVTVEGEDLPVLKVLGGGRIEADGGLRLSVVPDLDYASYQWRKNGMPLWDETSPTLERDPLLPEDAGAYDVLVGTGAKAVLTSEPTLVSIVPPNSLPVGGTFALALLTGALALAAARKKR